MMGHAEFERLANDRVEELLEAYAEARLDPAGPVVARIRANVMAKAAATAATYRLADPAPVAPARSRLAWLQSGLPRRAFALGLTATLTLGTTAAVLAAPPGSPFYNARLVVEAALLPAQLDARLAAYEEHFEDRLQEAEAAARAGDPNAVAAALSAYEDDVASALAAVGDDAELLARLEAMLAKHTAVLEALEARVPEQAAVDNAIANSQKAIAKIKEKAAGKDNDGGVGPNGGNGRPSQAPNSQAGGPPDDSKKDGEP